MFSCHVKEAKQQLEDAPHYIVTPSVAAVGVMNGIAIIGKLTLYCVYVSRFIILAIIALCQMMMY